MPIKEVVRQAEIAGNALAPGLSRREGRQQVLQGMLDRLPPELRSQLENEIRNKNTPETLMRELQRLGVSHTPENIVRIGRQPNGRVVFLETGDPTRGLQHILAKASDFGGRGVPQELIPDLLIAATTRGRRIGVQGRDRAIFEIEFSGILQYVSVSIADNGFIVGANPTKKALIRRFLGQDRG